MWSRCGIINLVWVRSATALTERGEMEKFVTVYKGSEPILVQLDAYLNSEVSWGKPVLVVVSLIVAVSIISMILKWS